MPFQGWKRWSAMAALSVVMQAQAVQLYELPAPPHKPSPTKIKDIDLAQFAAVMSSIQNYYIQPVSTSQLMQGAMKGMVASLDAHSRVSSFPTPEDSKTGWLHPLTQYSGIGLQLKATPQQLEVTQTISGSPADKAGIRRGDFITSVDNHAVQKMGVEKAIQAMRGKPGSKVHLGVIHHHEKKPIEIDVTRAPIKTPVVHTKKLEPGVGYIQVAMFDEHTAQGVHKSIDKLKKNVRSGD